MRREIARIADEPARAAEIGVALRHVLAHETVRAWFWDVWSRMRLAMEADAARPNGRSVVFLEGALANLGVLLETDPNARDIYTADLVEHGRRADAMNQISQSTYVSPDARTHYP